jgi:cytochrome c peroxidase
VALPPGSNINKQLPRPRQILNMGARGVNERETALIALGDMAFDSSFIFGEPARSLGISCNTCHNKSITNPQLFIPGLSTRPGTIDVSNSFFAPHANNGHFDPLDSPDLRGIRFTAPYGRNGRFASLREFTRNVIVNEFNGPEPDPLLLDGMIAYMNEFDFLPNPALNRDGTLNAGASTAARRGEVLFNRRFATMGNRSCATCHIPSARFLDHKRHDIGTAKGSEPFSQDRALDTPTLLSAKSTPPYFHDGSQPTLRAVNEWFNRNYRLGLTKRQIDDLTAYVETIGDGVEPYEDTLLTLEAEMEEFSFFLSAYETLRDKNKPELILTTLQTVPFEIRAHKWDVQDDQYLPVLEQLAEIIDRAYAEGKAGNWQRVDALVAEYRKLYQVNKERLV